MFGTLLVANRGEIARRVISTAKVMGIRTVAVHSDVDVDLPFVREADVAVEIGPGRTGRVVPERRADPAAPPGRPAPRRSTPGTGSSPRTPASLAPCGTPGWSGSDPRPR